MISVVKREKKIARTAFDKAYEQECADLIKKLRAKAKDVAEPDDIWRFHEFLTEKRDAIDEKYDYRYSVLLLVFARLINDGWLDINDLKGLSENKIDRIEALINFWNE